MKILKWGVGAQINSPFKEGGCKHTDVQAPQSILGGSS